jgi:AcrR family transcriptional regulator
MCNDHIEVDRRERHYVMTKPPKTTSRRAGGRGPRRTAKQNGALVLSREAIVGCALDLTEREGAGALTLRRLGLELGVDATAFYRHFRDKDELVLACMDRIIEMSYANVADRVANADWRTVISEVAWESWRMCEAHPAIYSIAFARTTGGPGERQMVELLVGALSSIGLDRSRTVEMYRLFVDSLLALCGMRATMLGLPSDVREKDATAWSRIYAVLPEVSYPATRAHADELASITDQSIFGALVETITNTIAAKAADPKPQESDLTGAVE